MAKSEKNRTPKRKKKLPPKRPAKLSPKANTVDHYSAFRDQQANISRARSAKGREIGPIPAVVDPSRRESCRLSLRLFNETYLSHRFPLAWSNDHLRAIAKLQSAILEGGQFAYAMPRGSGKTTLAEAGTIFAIGYGHRRFPVPIGSSEEGAKEMLSSIMMEFETNDLLAEDFPELCFPIRALEGIHHRANGQTLNGQRTRIVWTDVKAVFPTVPGSPSSGTVVRVAGITGRLRGIKHTLADGSSIRPDLAICDDPQSDESATSPAQCAKREKILNGAVMGLAGPKKKIACFVPCTVIAPGDVADRLLDRERNPAWQGERSKMVLSWPTDRELWDQYAEIRQDSQRAGGNGEEATDFYAANRAAMDHGAVVSWAERFNEDELSAIQNAMNLKIDRGERAFMAEFQNEPPIDDLPSDSRQVEEADLKKKLNNLPRGTVPRECNRLTAFIDIQAECLFWAVCGWTEKFGGALVDYGVFPPQPQAVFEAANPPVKFSDLYKKQERGARVYSALAEVVPQLVGRAYQQDGSDSSMTASVCLIDAGFETETIHEFISRSSLRAILKPSMGRSFKSENKPMRLYQRNPGDLVGHNWRMDAKAVGKGRYVMIDVNSWKSFMAELILAPAGASGSFYLPGKSLSDAPLLTLHLLSEYRIPTSGPWGHVEIWKKRPDREENHWWDCLVGAAVAASVQGLKWSATDAPPPPRTKKPPLSLAQKMALKGGPSSSLDLIAPAAGDGQDSMIDRFRN